MTPELVMSMTHQALRITIGILGPILLATLILGLVVSIFQAATQINEMTLTFIPKIIAVAATLIILGPWMLNSLVDYIQTLLRSIPSLAI